MCYICFLTFTDICYTRSSDWNGTISRTVTGKECLPWKNITSIGAESNLKFPDESLDSASNYCRDPNSTAALWCYISHNQTERCDVPPCDIPDAQSKFRLGTTAGSKGRSLLSFVRSVSIFICNRSYKLWCSIRPELKSDVSISFW